MLNWFKRRPPRNYICSIGPWMFDFESMHAKMHPKYGHDHMVSEASLVYDHDTVCATFITPEGVKNAPFFKEESTQYHLDEYYNKWLREKLNEVFEEKVLDGPTCG